MEKKDPARNLNRANPFKSSTEKVNQVGDDQEQLEKGFKPDYEGWAPIMARMIMRKQALWDMPNMIPGMTDPSQGYGAPWMAAGESPQEKSIPPKNWDGTVNIKGKNLKKYVRKQDSKKSVIEEYIEPGSPNYNYGEVME
jgi:hypothetical protein